MNRVAGADESYLLAEQLFGWSAPIQYAWVFTTEPDTAELTRFGEQLAAGSLSRKVVRAVVPFARHRWVRSPHPPVLRIDPEPIADTEIGAWADRTLRTADLDPVDGRGWQLIGVRTTAGRFVLSLLISHMVADGQGLYNALAAAHAGSSASTLPTEAEVLARPRWRGDVADALAQLGSAAAAARVIGTELWRTRDDPRPAAVRAPGTAALATDGPDTTLAIVDIDRARWAEQARRLGGTGNSLFTALLGGLVQRSGAPVGAEGLRVCIAVSNREAGDERANASGGVWIRVREPLSPDTGLAAIRTLSKEAFTRYATSGQDKLTDNLQPVVRLLPQRIIATMMRSIAGPDTTVSNLGAAPDSALTIAGRRAESFAIRAIMQGRSAAERRRQGPGIAAWAVEYDDKITITFFGIHPDHFGDEDKLRADITAELETWGLDGTAW
ncbi:hypothetical protein [Nocardia caishijiensis]|uniref:Condensation domain-containing protein n=1 Tax=Nocardia caishijiensis TaxID=184756 RepID=A0ABQ6YHI8_9NOCA|nr:hypothetical protein [Nocardia caishijiensis]KAF0845235.1 hypothetical protein FNL39_10843 [Nocardia caishijiensis]